MISGLEINTHKTVELCYFRLIHRIYHAREHFVYVSVLKEIYLYCQLTICVDSGCRQKNCRIQVTIKCSRLLEIPGKERTSTCVYKAGWMKKRTTRRLGKHMDNICFELSLIFFVTPLREGRLEIASWLRNRTVKAPLNRCGRLRW